MELLTPVSAGVSAAAYFIWFGSVMSVLSVVFRGKYGTYVR